MLEKFIEWCNVAREVLLYCSKPNFINKIKFKIINYIVNKY